MGSGLVSFKGDTWRGRTLLANNDRGDRRMVRIVNGYVSCDGHEIRSFPGWRTLVDLSDENNPSGGYNHDIIDAMRPVLEPPTPNDFYTQVYDGTTSAKQTLLCHAEPRYIEWFEQVGDVLTIGGITRFRECPIYDSNRIEPTIVSASNIQDGGNFRFFLRFSSLPASRTINDTGASLNGVAVGDVFYIEGLTVSGNATLQAAIDTHVNGKVHVLHQINAGGPDLRFFTDLGGVLGGAGPWTVTAGTCRRVRPNRSNTYLTPSGMDPYHSDPMTRIDDWNALTTWRIIPTLPMTIGNCTSHVAHTAYVANRRRDFADEASNFNEGVLTDEADGVRGVSRREQKELPYRMVPEPSGDRIIIAVPGYNCLFQVPLMIPVNPELWPATPTVDGLGVQWFANDQFDQPRALGLPKGRLIESIYTPAPSSPSETHQSADVTHLLTALSTSPQFSFPAGTYRMCITYADSATGDEGEPSEPVEFTVPSNGYAYVINVSYMLPGYIMPECVADELRVYMTDTDGEAFGLYKSLPLRHLTGSLDYLGYALENATGFSPTDLSSKYGPDAGYTPGDLTMAREWNTLRLPLARDNGGGIGDSIDFFRPPLPIGMPRGASAVKMVRGFLLAGGHLGTEGVNGSLYPAFGSLRVPGGDTNVVELRQHQSSNILLPADGALTDGFGLSSRNFPDSCQGITALSKKLVPNNMGREFQVDRVLNRKSSMRTSDASQMNVINWERLQTVRPVLDPDFRETPMAPAHPDYEVINQPFWWRMFKGQLQVGEPGLPGRVSKAGGFGIKIIDYNKDDDITAIGELAGNAVICSRYETYFLGWSTSPLGQEPTVITTEYGCIAPNSMVEFDGGLAWISEKGPVAIGGAGLQHIGKDIEEDFVGSTRRYLTDSKGMMRHTWSCHDAARGLVMWGMVVGDIALVESNGDTINFVNGSDGVRSRAACNEVLIWSYRTGSFSVWNPPTGLEVLWMRELAIKEPTFTNTGVVYTCFLANDNRIYALDDAWNDCNDGCLATTAVAAGTASTSLQVAATLWATDGVANGGDSAREISTAYGSSGNGFLLRVGTIVQALNADGEIEWETTVEAADPSTDVVTLAAAQTWTRGQTILLGVKPALEIESTSLGAEFLMNGHAKHVQVRYGLHGTGRCNATVWLLKTELDSIGGGPTEPIRCGKTMGKFAKTDTAGRLGLRRSLPAEVTAPELALRMHVSGERQIRIADVALELV